MVLIFRGYVSFRDCILFNKCDNPWWHLKIQYLFCFSQFLQIWNPKAVLAKKTVSLQELKSGVQRFRKVYVDVYIYIFYMIIKIWTTRNQTKSSTWKRKRTTGRESTNPGTENTKPHMYIIFLSDLLKKFISGSTTTPPDHLARLFFPLLHAGKPTFRKTWPGGLEWMVLSSWKKKTEGKREKLEPLKKWRFGWASDDFFLLEKKQMIFLVQILGFGCLPSFIST